MIDLNPQKYLQDPIAPGKPLPTLRKKPRVAFLQSLFKFINPRAVGSSNCLASTETKAQCQSLHKCVDCQALHHTLRHEGRRQMQDHVDRFDVGKITAREYGDRKRKSYKVEESPDISSGDTISRASRKSDRLPNCLLHLAS